jgi:hypothetical protein
MLARFLFGAAALVGTIGAAENYDEQAVPPYSLPDPLVMSSGEPVRDRADWEKRRRPELIEAFARNVYGRMPATKLAVKHDVVEDTVLPGTNLRRKQVRLTFTSPTERQGDGAPLAHEVMLLLHLPANAPSPVPVFLGLNYNGNAATTKHPGVALPTSWMRPSDEYGVVDFRATEKTRGARVSRWPVGEVIAAGYGVATAYYGDFFADHPEEGYRMSIQSLFPADERGPGPDKWGAIATWSWGLSRLMDYLVTDRQVDARCVAVMGHSRHGKAALWAGALDPRFAIVISNESGCGGAALSKRIFGETVGIINEKFPHWFCHNFRQFNGREADLPIDQHQLLALIAPRVVAVGSAAEDLWADPKGERLAVEAAAPVWAFLGAARQGAATGAAEDREVERRQYAGGRLFYHLRPGRHDINAVDWREYIRVMTTVRASRRGGEPI